MGGRVIHERTFPHFKERPEYLHNKERGKSKWNYIIKKNLPNLRGKVVYDVGCNIGLFSLFMAQMGACKVIGLDRGKQTEQPTNQDLPSQDIVQQAYFVRNLFKLAGDGLYENVEFKEADIATLDFSTFQCDFLFATCVLYHFGEERFQEILCQSSHIPEIFLQTNLGHQGKNLKRLVQIDYQKRLLERNGYEVKVVNPVGYEYPIIYGKKKNIRGR